MFRIQTHLDLLLSALESGKPLFMPLPHAFDYEGPLTVLFRYLFKSKEKWLSRFSSQFMEHVDSLERIPVYFGLQGEATPQAIDYPGYLAILSWLEVHVEELALKAQLKRRFIAMKYRVGAVNGGWSPQALDSDLSKLIIDIAELWKKEQLILMDKAINERDRKKIELASCYPHFIDLITESALVREEFFLWILQDQNAVEPFILFPAIQQKIVNSNLNGRIGRLGGRLLSIKRVPIPSGQLQQIVTLPFEGRVYNILDETAVVPLRGNYSLPIKSIFEVFKNKETKVGNLEVFSNGILNWNAHYHGYYDAAKNQIIQIDLDQPGWWKQLPVIETLSVEQAQQRYDTKELNGTNWDAAASASRDTTTLNYEGTHAYLEVAIPTGDGKYSIYDFGKFSYKFPETELDKLTMFANNLQATVAYPDENIYYTHRQHARYSFLLTPQEGFRLMDTIKEDLCLAKEGNLVYQIESDNCAKWLHEKIESVVGPDRMPNLFKVPLLEAEPKGFMAWAFKLLKMLPKPIQVPVFMFLHLPFAPFRGQWIEEDGKKVYKSLMTHDFWKSGVVYLPCYLHHQKLQKTVDRPEYAQMPELPGWIRQVGVVIKESNHRGKRHPHKKYMDAEF